MGYLKVGHYIGVLLKEGTEWEFKEILPSKFSIARYRKRYTYIKRLILALPTLTMLLLLKNGFNTEFIGYIMAALAIFIGLFTNLIIVLYQRYTALAIRSEDTLTSLNERLNDIKVKNFIKQFTFVTGKNLLIATLVIILVSFYMLFHWLGELKLSDYTYIKSVKEINYVSVTISIKFIIAIITRVSILYLLIDFCLLLLYTLGALFTFLKGEYKQD